MLFLNAVRDFSEEDVGFTDEQARALINGVRSAKNNDSSILSVSEVIDTIITNFAAADRYDLIEELFEIAPEEMAASSTACQSITVSLGFSLAGFEVSPQKATGRFAKQWSDYINLYKTTAENCRKLKFPEAGYVFDLVISIMEGENIEVIKAIADDTAEMSPQEIEFVRTITMGLLVGDYMKNPDSSQAVERARARTIEMIERYGVEDPTETLDSTLTFYRNNISE